MNEGLRIGLTAVVFGVIISWIGWKCEDQPELIAVETATGIWVVGMLITISGVLMTIWTS